MNQTKKKTWRRARIYEGGSRGGCINQEDLEGVVTRMFDHDDYKATVQLKAATWKKSLNEFCRDVAYCLRVMLSHVRIKFEQYHGLADRKKTRDPQELLDIYGAIKRGTKPKHRCGFKNFRGSDSESEQSDDPPTVVSIEYSLGVNKVIRRMSDGEAIPASLYEADTVIGFLIAIFADGERFQTEVPNTRLENGKIKMDAPPPTAAKRIDPLLYSAGFTFPPGRGRRSLCLFFGDLDNI